MSTPKRVISLPINPQPRRVDDAFDGTWEWLIPGVYFDDLTMAPHLREYAERALSRYPHALLLGVAYDPASNQWSWALEVTDGYPNGPN